VAEAENKSFGELEVCARVICKVANELGQRVVYNSLLLIESSRIEIWHRLRLLSRYEILQFVK
jgi:hypothetical protein